MPASERVHSPLVACAGPCLSSPLTSHMIIFSRPEHNLVFGKSFDQPYWLPCHEQRPCHVTNRVIWSRLSHTPSPPIPSPMHALAQVFTLVVCTPASPSWAHAHCSIGTYKPLSACVPPVLGMRLPEHHLAQHEVAPESVAASRVQCAVKRAVRSVDRRGAQNVVKRGVEQWIPRRSSGIMSRGGSGPASRRLSRPRSAPLCPVCVCVCVCVVRVRACVRAGAWYVCGGSGVMGYWQCAALHSFAP